MPGLCTDRIVADRCDSISSSSPNVCGLGLSQWNCRKKTEIRDGRRYHWPRVSAAFSAAAEAPASVQSDLTTRPREVLLLWDRRLLLQIIKQSDKGIYKAIRCRFFPINFELSRETRKRMLSLSTLQKPMRCISPHRTRVALSNRSPRVEARKRRCQSMTKPIDFRRVMDVDLFGRCAQVSAPICDDGSVRASWN